MIASLPMYATPQTAGADARFWALIRDNLRALGGAAPDTLVPAPADLMAHWRDPGLVFSQTCGMPFRAALQDSVTLIGTPDYGVDGCPPGYYCSVIIARIDDPREALDDFRAARFAYNDPMSQSGWAAVAMQTPEALQGPRLCTGSHRGSVKAVQQFEADFASIDAVTWHHLTTAGETAGLRIIHRTQPTPGLPYITAKSGSAPVLFEATAAAIAALSASDQQTLHLKDLIAIPKRDYKGPLPPNPSAKAH